MSEVKDPFDADGNLILTPAEIDEVLERYDQTPVPLQRQIVAAFLMQLQAAKEKIKELEALLVKEGPLNSEDMRLDDLLAILEQWKSVASGKTCVSFVNICYGASSLWHQTHMDNFRAVDRHPKELSEWVLNHVGHVSSFHFPEQVLEILKKLAEENARLKELSKQ